MQFIVAKIVQDIHDIKKRTTTHHMNNPSKGDIYGRGGEHCNNSSYNTPQCQSKPDNQERHAPYHPDTPSLQNETPVQRCPSSDPSSSLATSAGRSIEPHMDWRDMISGHMKLTDLERKSSIQSGDGPWEMNPDLKKVGGMRPRGEGERTRRGQGNPLIQHLSEDRLRGECPQGTGGENSGELQRSVQGPNGQ